MVYVGEEFSYIALENPSGASMVARNLARELIEAIHRFVSTFPTAG